MKPISFVSLLALGAVGYSAILVEGCGSDVKLCDNGACDAPLDGSPDVTTTDGPGKPDSPVTDDGGSDGSTDDGPADALPDNAPPGCEPAKDPKDSTPCVSDVYGLFVDASKPAGGTGTKANPFNSIGAAVTAAASASQKRIYVCAGTYAEAITLTNATSIYGGWSCADWSYSGTKGKVAPTALGVALQVANVAGAVTVEDLEFDAKPGTIVSRDSIAAFVKASPSVTLSRVALVAGAGYAGANGAAGTTGSPVSGDLNGNPASGNNAGGEKTCACTTGGTSTGGKGGIGGAVPGDGDTGKVVQGTPMPSTATGAGQTAADCLAGTNSARPGSGLPAAGNGPGAGGGTLDATGFHGGDGTVGSNGLPGQGGGGGGGQATGGGGGGACGGCGGGGGGFGTAGGSSIALATLASPVQLSNCAITTSTGGLGGSGASGASGAAGGIRGGGSGNGCNGAAGGMGGAGGVGGGGTGGHSIGVVYQGTAPSLGSSTVSTSVPGPAGTGPGSAGKPGVKADIRDVATL